MHIIPARNVNEAFVRGMRLLLSTGVVQPSRDGEVITAVMPTVTHYRQPGERVLFHPRRRANPFFHLSEAFWMLAGQNDGTFLDRFVRGFSSRFAEVDGTIHGAYGHRWRHALADMDQLDQIVDVLMKAPNSRQAVLQMWAADMDLGSVSLRDRPCNTTIYFRKRERGGSEVLDMTVCCRSNDIIMGAYGANVVHMSVLQEYIATQLGLQLGHYWQISNDFHAYARDLSRYGHIIRDGRLLSRSELAEMGEKEATNWLDPIEVHDLYTRGSGDRYDSPVLAASPLFSDGKVPLLQELEAWVMSPEQLPHDEAPSVFSELLIPMVRAHTIWKRGDREGALVQLDAMVGHRDWWHVAVDWVKNVRPSASES